MAKSYEFVRGVPGALPTINGETFPWFVDEQGPMVEAFEDDIPLHILWVPIVVDAPMPTPPEGRPEGEPVT